jgi:hypothetical protein
MSMASCMALLLISPARADLKVCNDQPVMAKVALVLVGLLDQFSLIPPKDRGFVDPNATDVDYTVRGWWRIPPGECRKIDFSGVAWGARWEPWNFDPGADDRWPKFPIVDQDFSERRFTPLPNARRVPFDWFGTFPSSSGGKTATLHLLRSGSALVWD